MADDGLLTAPAGRNVGFYINRAMRLLRELLEIELAGAGINAQQAAAIREVHRREQAGDPGTVTEICHYLAIDRSVFSALLTRLVRGRWLATQPNPADSRSRLVVVGDRGVEMMPGIAAATQRSLERACADLTPEQLDQLARLLGIVIGAAERELGREPDA